MGKRFDKMSEPTDLMDVANGYGKAHHEQVLKRMAAKCDHVWNLISVNPKDAEYVTGLGDHPEICRKCGTLRSGSQSEKV